MAIRMIFSLVLLGSCVIGGDSLVISDYSLFRNTPVQEIASAIEKNRITALPKLLEEKGKDLNFQEPKYGATLLVVVTVNRNYEACRLLLEAGADPNIPTTFDGSFPITYASRIEGYSEDDTEFIRLLLDFGADANSVQVGSRGPDNTIRESPLMAACRNLKTSSLPKVTLLVETGADVNFEDEFGNSVLGMALTFDQMDVVEFLLERGVDYSAPLRTLPNGQPIYITNRLRIKLYPLGSKKHADKMRVVKFLEDHNIDYRNTEVPPHIVSRIKKMYPDSWKDYLAAY